MVELEEEKRQTDHMMADPLRFASIIMPLIQPLSKEEHASLHAATTESQIDLKTAIILGRLTQRIMRGCAHTGARVEEDAITSAKKKRHWEQTTDSMLKTTQDERSAKRARLPTKLDAIDDHDTGDVSRFRYNFWRLTGLSDISSKSHPSSGTGSSTAEE